MFVRVRATCGVHRPLERRFKVNGLRRIFVPCTSFLPIVKGDVSALASAVLVSLFFRNGRGLVNEDGPVVEGRVARIVVLRFFGGAFHFQLDLGGVSFIIVNGLSCDDRKGNGLVLFIVGRLM